MMLHRVFNKRAKSSLSTDRLRVLLVDDDTVYVQSYNFYKKKWNQSGRDMKRDWFLKNYKMEATK